MAEEPARVPLLVFPWMGVAGLTIGLVAPFLVLWLGWGHPEGWRWNESSPWGCVGAIHGCLIGAALVSTAPGWVRALAVCVGGLFVWTLALRVLAPQHWWYLYSPGEAIARGSGLALLSLAVFAVHAMFLDLRRRGRIGVLAPYAYVAAGTLLGVGASVLAVDVARGPEFIAIGALGGLVQYYALVVALAFHERRSAAPGPKDTRTSP